MTIRNLDAVFRPRSVALIGASRRAGSVGAVVARNLAGADFRGPLWAIHPEGARFPGFRSATSIGAMPEAPDLAVICTPPDAVPGLVAELGARGTRGAVVITAGFGESRDAAGPRRQQAMLDAARPHLLRIVGPNCVGIAVPGAGLNAGFAHLAPRPGGLAFVTQSGAVLTSVLDWAHTRGIGFSHLVSLGDMADVDFGDMLDYLAADPGTRAILLYIEAVTHARKFMSAARAAARMKPVTAIKAGRHAEGAKAAASHTGALAGLDAAYDAAFRRAGILRVHELDELFDAVETLSAARMPAGDRLAIVTNGGGIGVMATDALIARGGRLADLSPGTMAALDAALPRTWSHGNPVDIIGDADGARYAAAIAAVAADPGVDALLVLNCPTAIASPDEAARASADALANVSVPVFTSWLGGDAASPARRRLAAARIPTYSTPGQAVRGFMTMVEYRRGQSNLMRVPPAAPADEHVERAAAEAVIERALRDGVEWLDEPSAKAVLAAYRVPVVESHPAASAAEAAAIAARLGGRVALKILSPDITHKTDVGGVVLGLAPGDVAAAAEVMRARVASSRPDARIAGFTVSPMVRVADGFELILGAVEDVQFGPLVLFGQGGTAVEVVADRALALPPLDPVLAGDLIDRTRIARLLAGYRDKKPADRGAIVRALIGIGRLVAELPDVAELDVNPFVVGPAGGVALDARIRVRRRTSVGADRLAIRPYPRELERLVTLRDGRRLLLRPVRPEDEPAFRRAFARLDPADIRMRFHGPMRALSPDMAARMTQIDYDREMAFVLADEGPAGSAEIHGVARLHADPDNVAAEYAIIVQSDEKGRGLGYALMTELIAHARRRGLRQIFGFVLHSNAPMLAMCRELGFAEEADAEAPEVLRVTLALEAAAPAAGQPSVPVSRA